MDDGEPQNYHFQKLAIIQFKLINIGNTDFKEFDFGLSIPEKTDRIGIDDKSGDRKHTVTYTPDFLSGRLSNNFY